MQLYALTHTTPISATRAEKRKDYKCPECGATVRLRSGPSKQPHFYHLSAPKHCRQHTKSLEHLQLQLKLVTLLTPLDAQIESPFPSINRIADVAWHSKKIVFEIQCSPISLEEAKERTLDYASLGYQVIWILHDKRFNKKTLSAAESYLRTTPCYFTNSDKTGSGIVYDQFETLSGARRTFKGPPLPLIPTNIFPLPTIAAPDLDLPAIILQRLSQWKCYTEGDLLHHLLKEGNLSQTAKRLLALETKRQKTKRLPLKILIAKSYRALLEHMLSTLAG